MPTSIRINPSHPTPHHTKPSNTPWASPPSRPSPPPSSSSSPPSPSPPSWPPWPPACAPCRCPRAPVAWWVGCVDRVRVWLINQGATPVPRPPTPYTNPHIYTYIAYIMYIVHTCHAPRASRRAPAPAPPWSTSRCGSRLRVCVCVSCSHAWVGGVELCLLQDRTARGQCTNTHGPINPSTNGRPSTPVNPSHKTHRRGRRPP